MQASGRKCSPPLCSLSMVHVLVVEIVCKFSGWLSKIVPRIRILRTLFGGDFEMKILHSFAILGQPTLELLCFENSVCIWCPRREGQVTGLEGEVKDLKESLAQLQLERTELIAKVCTCFTMQWHINMQTQHCLCVCVCVGGGGGGGGG